MFKHQMEERCPFFSLPLDVLKLLLGRLPVRDIARCRCVCRLFKKAVDGGDGGLVLKAVMLECIDWNQGESLQVRVKRAEKRLEKFRTGHFEYEWFSTKAPTLLEAVAERKLVPKERRPKLEAQRRDFLPRLGLMDVRVLGVSFTSTVMTPWAVCMLGRRHVIVGQAVNRGTVQVWRIDEGAGTAIKIAERSGLVEEQWDTCYVEQMQFPVFAFASGRSCVLKVVNGEIITVMDLFNPMHPDPHSKYHRSSLGTENIRRMLGGRVLAEHYYEHPSVAFWELSDEGTVRLALVTDMENIRWIDSDESVVCGEGNVIALHDRGKEKLHVFSLTD
jgi:hypothetical protein